MSYSPFSPFGSTNSFINSRIASDMSSGRYRGSSHSGNNQSASNNDLLKTFDRFFSKVVEWAIPFIVCFFGFIVAVIFGELSYAITCSGVFITFLYTLVLRLKKSIFNDSERKKIKTAIIKVIIYGLLSSSSAILIYLHMDHLLLDAFTVIIVLIILLTSQSRMLANWFNSPTEADAVRRYERDKEAQILKNKNSPLCIELEELINLRSRGKITYDDYYDKRRELINRMAD